MRKKSHFYKVVWVDENRQLWSAIMRSVRYRVGKWVAPKPGEDPLFVFPTRARARKFLKTRWHGFRRLGADLGGKYRIYSCDIVAASRCPTWALHMLAWDAPSGASFVLAEKVRLLKSA